MIKNTKVMIQYDKIIFSDVEVDVICIKLDVLGKEYDKFIHSNPFKNKSENKVTKYISIF
jgi:hypothetical protein